jgi:hypothetical protein
MAGISLEPGATATCPSTNRLASAQALTSTSASLPAGAS